MQFCANNLKTIAFSKILMESKSVQHDEIYLCAYFEENSLTGIRVIALFMRFLAYLMFKSSKIFFSETAERICLELCSNDPWHVGYKRSSFYNDPMKNMAAVTKNRT